MTDLPTIDVKAGLQIFQTIDKRQDILAQQDAELQQRQEALDALESRIAAARAYEVALAQYVEEVEAQHADLRTAVPAEAHAVQERLAAQHAELQENDEQLARQGNARQHVTRELEDLEAERRRLSGLVVQLGKLVAR